MEIVSLVIPLVQLLKEPAKWLYRNATEWYWERKRSPGPHILIASSYDDDEGWNDITHLRTNPPFFRH